MGPIVQKTGPQKPLKAFGGSGGPGMPRRFLESLPPPSDRQDRHPPASRRDHDDVLGPTLKAAHDPLTSVMFGWRDQAGVTVFADGIFHSCAWPGGFTGSRP